jgi:hypothetical protein
MRTLLVADPFAARAGSEVVLEVTAARVAEYGKRQQKTPRRTPTKRTPGERTVFLGN